jgi:hypothetical protein
MTIDYTPEWRKQGISNPYNPKVSPLAFFRIDDVGYEDPKFYNLATFLLNLGIPLNVAIIPTEIKNISSRSLDLIHNRNIFPLQHGHSHSIEYREENDFGEFHSSLDYQSNLNKIREGKRLFNKSFNPTKQGFIPPRHSFPQIKIILEEGYDIISGYGDQFEKIDQKLLSLPVNLDVIRDYSTREMYTEEELVRRVDRIKNNQGFIGILLHHNFLPESFEESLSSLIDLLKKQQVPILRLDEI